MSSFLSLILATTLLRMAEPAPASPPPIAEAEVHVEHATVDTPSPTRELVLAASPLPRGHRMGSGFGFRTSHRTGARQFHAGLDFVAERGTPVYAVRPGIVELVAHDRGPTLLRGYGNAVVVHHPDEARWTLYAHLDSIDVELGQHVDAGAMLGRVGNTNNRRFEGMGSHLHFEVRRARTDGTSPFPGTYRRFNVDPARWLAQQGLRFEGDASEGDDRPEQVMTTIAAVSEETDLVSSFDEDGALGRR
jgi:murein DD-endopeptidase MepM/ murein hydrolase activator NlpD